MTSNYKPVDLTNFSYQARKLYSDFSKETIARLTTDEYTMNIYKDKYAETYVKLNSLTEKQSKALQNYLTILSTLSNPFNKIRNFDFEKYKKTLQCMEAEIEFKSDFSEIYGINRSNMFMYLNREPEFAMVKGVYEMNNELYNNNQLIDNKYKTYSQLIYGHGKSKISKIYEIDFEFPRIFNYNNDFTKVEDIQDLMNKYDEYNKYGDEEKKNLIIKYLNELLPEDDAIEETDADTTKKGIDKIKGYLSTPEERLDLRENLIKKNLQNKNLRNLKNYIQYKNAMDKLFRIHFEKKYPDLELNPLRNELVGEMRDFYENILFASDNPMVNGKQIDKIVDDEFIKKFSESDEIDRLVIFNDLMREVDSKFIYRQAINKVINDFVNKEIDSDGNIIYKGFKNRKELSKTDFSKEGVTSDHIKEELKKALANEVIDAVYSITGIDKYSKKKSSELPEVTLNVIDEITEINEEFKDNLYLIGEVMNELDFKERLKKIKTGKMEYMSSII